MRRRTFIKAVGAAGLSSTLWEGLYAKAANDPVFLKKQTSNSMLFPRPADGAECAITPVGLAWLPCPGADSYRVHIHSEGGTSVYTGDAGENPVHVPDQILPTGTYVWDVTALDRRGKVIAKRGKQRFTIKPGAAELPWVDPKVLLKRVPDEHPRILYPKASLSEIRATLTSTRAQAWKACKSAADRAINKGLPEFPSYHKIKDPGTRRLEYSRYFSYIRKYIDSALMSLSLAFVMTEDPKYARPAKRLLLELANWPTDDRDVTSVSAQWGDEIGLSFSKCAHIAYDWLYPALTRAERQKVFAMCHARAWQTYRRLERHKYLTHPGNSHEGRLIAYLTDMSLAMAHKTEDAEAWLTYSLKAMMTFYPHWAGVDGGWAEGVPYGLWYNGFYIPAFESLRELTGHDLWQRPFFNQIRYFFYYCTANHGEIRPFGDSAEGGGPGVGRGSGYAELMAFHAHRFNDPTIGWWVKQIPGFTGARGGFHAMCFEDALPAAAPKGLPNARVFKTVGWAGLHSDMTDPKTDTCLIFKSSPYGSVSHSHADQNAFAIMKGGKALATPSGYYGPTYGKPHHAKWTRSTKANNCILVDGEGQVIRSRDAKGRIVAFEDRPGYTYVSGDATAAYAGKLRRWIRHIVFLRPGTFLVLDDIESPTESQYQWMLHAFERMQIQDQSIISTRGNALLHVHLACSQGLELSQTDQFETPYNEGIPPAYHKDKPNQWHVTASTLKRSSRTRIAAVMTVYQTEAPMMIKLHRRRGWLGVSSQGHFGQVEGWIKLNGQARTTKGLSGHEIPESVDIWTLSANKEVFKRNSNT